MPGRYLDLATSESGTFRGYLSLPASGSGPGLLLAQEIFGVNSILRAAADLFAEEGYVVLVPDLFWRLQPGVDLGDDPAGVQQALEYYQRFDVDLGVQDLGTALQALRALPQRQGEVGILGFCLGGLLAYLAAARLKVDAAVSFYGVGIEKYLGEAGNIACPLLFHFAGRDEHVPPAAVEAIRKAFDHRKRTHLHVYPDANHAFYLPGRRNYHPTAASVAHSYTIGLLRETLGPEYDLVAMWEQHCALEFEHRNAEETMKTMIPDPYVNHIPTMTGGVGYKDLVRFYRHHFIGCLPADTRVTPISRTVGADRVVDEVLFSFTHDRVIDFLLPDIPPTGKRVEIPMVAVVSFRGDKLCNEHIYWDQASLLVQVGLLDPKLLPITGVEATRKLLDKRLPSNTLMKARWAETAALG